MGTLNAEMLRGGRFTCGRDARIELFDSIEACYNTRRRHSAIGCLSLADFETGHHPLN